MDRTTTPGTGRTDWPSDALHTPGLTTLDREREGSMADEGGTSGMFMETQLDVYEPYDGPVLEWYEGTDGPSPLAIAAGITLGLAGVAALSFVALKLARRH